jgi:hypothetical protein
MGTEREKWEAQRASEREAAIDALIAQPAREHLVTLRAAVRETIEAQPKSPEARALEAVFALLSQQAKPAQPDGAPGEH